MFSVIQVKKNLGLREFNWTNLELKKPLGLEVKCLLTEFQFASSKSDQKFNRVHEQGSLTEITVLEVELTNPDNVTEKLVHEFRPDRQNGLAGHILVTFFFHVKL